MALEVSFVTGDTKKIHARSHIQQLLEADMSRCLKTSEGRPLANTLRHTMWSV